MNAHISNAKRLGNLAFDFCHALKPSRIIPALAILGALCAMLAASQTTQAQTLTTLYSFTGGTDGSTPAGGLIFDAQGNLYGATRSGGAYGDGSVFEFTASGTQKVLYSFTGGADGSGPTGDLTRDAHGNLYGTTRVGGDLSGCGNGYGCGVLFEVTPSGTETVLYTFTGGNDGAYPEGGLLLDTKGDLYGTTQGSLIYPAIPATLFEVNSSGVFSVIYTFPPLSKYYAAPFPNGGLLMDSQGNFYGTTQYGGTRNACAHHTTLGCGTVFKVTPSGAGTMLLDLVDIGATWPLDGLIADAQGNLYGTTELPSHGTVFELTSSGTGIVLATFKAGKNAGKLQSRLVMDGIGNLYGTGLTGGGDGKGAVFEITASGTEKVLYGFNPKKHPGVGADPSGALILDAQGSLYGMTAGGGAYGYGTVYKLIP